LSPCPCNSFSRNIFDQSTVLEQHSLGFSFVNLNSRNNLVLTSQISQNSTHNLSKVEGDKIWFLEIRYIGPCMSRDPRRNW
jgi:hypothetical protein